MDNQLIFVITAASATGKTSCAKQACAKGKNLVLSISHSTRPMRPGEKDGVDKYFIQDSEFEAMDKSGDFVEQTRIFGHRCGHTKAKLHELAGQDNDLIMILDYQGMLQIKQQYENTVSIFLLPPDTQAIAERIDKRPEADGVDIDARIRSAKREMQDYKHYDYTVINDVLEDAVSDILTIVKAERLKTAQQQHREKECIDGLEI